MKRREPIGVLCILAVAGLGGCDPRDEPVSPTETNHEKSHLMPHRPKDEKLAQAREKLLATLRSDYYRINDEKVLQAMAAVPREEFCADAYRSMAYDNRALPIGWGQTISQPYVVAFMTEHLELEPTDRVLEIGTGSGYQAAVLSVLVDRVYSIEIVDPLAELATKRLDELGYDNVTVKAGDGYQGWAEHAPFDAVIVTCAPERIPQPLIDQLREGGTMMIPVGDSSSQELILLRKKDGEVTREKVLRVFFVPMTGEVEEEKRNR